MGGNRRLQRSPLAREIVLTAESIPLAPKRFTTVFALKPIQLERGRNGISGDEVHGMALRIATEAHDGARRSPIGLPSDATCPDTKWL